jgi:hypothetical protein
MQNFDGEIIFKEISPMIERRSEYAFKMELREINDGLIYWM